MLVHEADQNDDVAELVDYEGDEDEECPSCTLRIGIDSIYCNIIDRSECN